VRLTQVSAVMRWTAGAALTVALCAAGTASAADRPAEGYQDAGGRVGCVIYQNYDRHGNAVKCGGHESSRGLLLPSAGAASAKPWRWPARTLGDLFFTARYGQTLYLYGGTAKLQGDDSILRCTFKRLPSVRARCLNGDGHGIVVTRTRTRRIAR
jgi:hypothetical protein